MTNAESNLKSAVKALESGKLNAYEAEFVEGIKHFTKHQLKILTSKQYRLLVSCADKAD